MKRMGAKQTGTRTGAAEEKQGLTADGDSRGAGAVRRGAHPFVHNELAELAPGDGEDDGVEDVRDHFVELVQKVEDLGRDLGTVLVDVQA